MTLQELNILANAELESINKYYKNRKIFNYLLECAYGIDYEEMILALSSNSYIDLYKEKLHVYSYGKEISRDIPSCICKEIRLILQEGSCNTTD